ncbi:MAG: hypothetical protein HW421_1054 [Ignavibacteria bacterium]|nr:hypothetical protein [Ignavibacteria bacterium]
MKFTDAQKHYIEHINNGEIVDIETFLEILLFDCPSINDETKTFYFELNEKKIEKYFDDDKVIVYFEQIKEFASIIEYLRIKELKSETISIIHNKIICIRDCNEVPINLPYIKNLDYLNRKLKDIFEETFIPLPSLGEFIENGYKTKDEITFDEQIQQSKENLNHAQKQLTRTTYALIISAILTLSSIVVTIVLNSKDRNVKIINSDEFNRIQKVIIVNDSTQTKTKKNDDNQKQYYYYFNLR